MPFTHSINPVFFNLGPIEIRYYGLFYMLGFLGGYLLISHYAKKGKIPFTKDDTERYTLWLVIGSIFGARLFHVLFWGIDYYIKNPLEILMLWEGGMSFHGGFLGAGIASYFFCKRKRISFLKFADLVIPYVAFIFAMGRIVNFVNGELWGTVTNLPWCVNFSGIDGCRHPYQIYSALKRFAILGLLLAFKRVKHKPGLLLWLFVGLVGIGRFILDFLRPDPKFLGLVSGQWLSFAMVAIAVFFLARQLKTGLIHHNKH